MRTLIKAKQHIVEPRRYFNSCHASTLAALKDGTVLASWFAGTHENHVDVGIWTAKMQNGVFSAPVRAAWDDTWPCWNPVLHLGPNGIVYLFYKVGKNPRVWHTMLITSRDNGKTWSEPKKIVADDRCGRGPVKNKILITRDRRWLAPASRESQGLWEAFVDISEDEGETWTATDMVPADRSSFAGPGVIQPAIWESESGNVHMLMRSSEKAIFRSDSRDGGLTWCEIYPTELPNNNSGIDAVMMENGVLALVYNPVAANWGVRTPLSLSLSSDNGKTWEYTAVLDENLEPQNREDGEFSYPAIIARGDSLLITYTWRRKTVEYVDIEVKP